ncbi:hypothetical protein V1281_001952 [Nitrobacteraceae bacterium AZCC 2161]
MLLSVLKERFEEAEFDGWEGYVFVHYPEGEDWRDDCFKRLRATVDVLPATLRERTEQFLAVDAALFDEVLKDLSAEVGWDYFPKDAAAFVTTLIEKLESSSPETRWHWRSEPEPEMDFCEAGMGNWVVVDGQVVITGPSYNEIRRLERAKERMIRELQPV